MRCGSFTCLYGEINEMRVYYMFLWGNQCGAGLLHVSMGKSMRCGAVQTIAYLVSSQVEPVSQSAHGANGWAFDFCGL
jgi:hypothetical protein